MLKAGIDSSFSPHAAVSTAKLQGVPLQIIMKTAGWANASVFARFYDKPVISDTKTVLEGQ